MFLAFKAVAGLEAGGALGFAWTLQKNNLIYAIFYSCIGVMQIIHDENCIRLNIMFLSSKTFLMFHAGAMMKLFLIASLKVGSNDMICCSMEN